MILNKDKLKSQRVWNKMKSLGEVSGERPFQKKLKNVYGPIRRELGVDKYPTVPKESSKEKKIRNILQNILKTKTEYNDLPDETRAILDEDKGLTRKLWNSLLQENEKERRKGKEKGKEREQEQETNKKLINEIKYVLKHIDEYGYEQTPQVMIKLLNENEELADKIHKEMNEQKEKEREEIEEIGEQEEIEEQEQEKEKEEEEKEEETEDLRKILKNNYDVLRKASYTVDTEKKDLIPFKNSHNSPYMLRVNNKEKRYYLGNYSLSNSGLRDNVITLFKGENAPIEDEPLTGGLTMLLTLDPYDKTVSIDKLKALGLKHADILAYKVILEKTGFNLKEIPENTLTYKALYDLNPRNVITQEFENAVFTINQNIESKYNQLMNYANLEQFENVKSPSSGDSEYVLQPNMNETGLNIGNGYLQPGKLKEGIISILDWNNNVVYKTKLTPGLAFLLAHDEKKDGTDDSGLKSLKNATLEQLEQSEITNNDFKHYLSILLQTGLGDWKDVPKQSLAYRISQQFKPFTRTQINEMLKEGAGYKKREKKIVQSNVSDNGAFGNYFVSIPDLNRNRLVLYDSKKNVILDTRISNNLRALIQDKTVGNNVLNNLNEQDVDFYTKLIEKVGIRIPPGNNRRILVDTPSKFISSNDALKDRLNLLLSSKQAGNNSRKITSEIAYILNKLKESGTVDDDFIHSISNQGEGIDLFKSSDEQLASELYKLMKKRKRSNAMKNEIVYISDELLRRGVLDNEQHRHLYYNYCK